MLINLKTCAAKAEQQETKIELHERIPGHISLPCIADCCFFVDSFDNYYLMKLDIDVRLLITCQRCLHEFIHHYKNQTVLAVCNSDEMAEKLMAQYECVASHNNQIDLKELVADELYLYAPEFHLETSDCNSEVNQFINAESTIKS